MHELQDSRTKFTPYCHWALFFGAVCNPRTRLLPFAVKKKFHEWSLKIQLASDRCRRSPDDPLRYRSDSLRDTHIVTLAGDLWPEDYRSHMLCGVGHSLRSEVYGTRPCMSARWDNACVAMWLRWWVKGDLSVYLLFSADKSSSMLIRALAPLSLMTSQVKGDVNIRPLTAKCCHHSPPSIHPYISCNERLSWPPTAAQKLESWLWIYMSV